MTTSIRVSGATETITAGKVMAGGVVRPLKTIKVMDGGTLRTVATFVGPLSLSATDAYGFIASASAATVTTSTSTATPVGGAGPYTYAWTLISSSGGDTPTINSPSFASTSFSKPNVADGQTFTAVFRCTVTDVYGSTASDDITATFENFGSEIA